MTGALLVGAGGPVLAAVVAWLCTRGYYRAAYGDRYERGYADGRAAQIRAYQDASVSLADWRKRPMLPARPRPAFARDAHSAGETLLVLGSGYPRAAGPPRYAQLSPEQLDDGPPTSEWARDLIADVKSWNARHLASRDAAWQD